MSIGAEIQKEHRPRNSRWDWPLWWRIDPVQLDEQVRLYNELGFRNAMRGISVACLALSIGVTIAMILLGALKSDSYIDVGLMAVLSLFIWLGHRWAMIAAMVLWTLEKAMLIPGNPVSVIPQVLWWAVYMHAFYFAFRIEQRRKSDARLAPASGI